MRGTVMQDDNDNWDNMYRALLEHGTNKKGTYDVLKSLRVPVTSEDGASQVLHLGLWLHKQREEKLEGSLHADKEALLQVSSTLPSLLLSTRPRLFLLYPILSYPIFPFPLLPSPLLHFPLLSSCPPDNVSTCCPGDGGQRTIDMGASPCCENTGYANQHEVY